MNFGISRDLPNTGVSGAVHPGTLSAFEKLFTLIAGNKFKIHNPFLFKTKAGVIEVLKKYGRLNLMPGSVSCSGTGRKLPAYTHCGVCPGCIIRIFAAYTAGSERYDEGIYSTDFLKGDITDPELIKTLVSIIKQAQNFSVMHFDDFYNEWGGPIAVNEKPADGNAVEQGLKKFYNLCRNHASDIEAAVKRMGDINNPLFAKYNPRSFFSLIVAPKLYQREEESCMYAGQENLKEVPVKGLKKLAGETCESLIKKNRIVEVMEETRKNRKISSLIVQELKEQRYSITKRNEDTISDYFRKLDLQIKKARTGRLFVIYN